MSEHSYHKLYDRLVDEVKTLYYANQVRIHKGLWALIISTVLFLTIMFITNGSKVIFLLMWIAITELEAATEAARTAMTQRKTVAVPNDEVDEIIDELRAEYKDESGKDGAKGASEDKA